ncbi:MAG: hypothetical protein J0H68_05695 [Sphingobacteriia bacterium]|nr:hypothetical protein [Sphingobacteriia bacterium]
MPKKKVIALGNLLDTIKGLHEQINLISSYKGAFISELDLEDHINHKLNIIEQEFNCSFNINQRLELNKSIKFILESWLPKYQLRLSTEKLFNIQSKQANNKRTSAALWQGGNIKKHIHQDMSDLLNIISELLIELESLICCANYSALLRDYDYNLIEDHAKKINSSIKDYAQAKKSLENSFDNILSYINYCIDVHAHHLENIKPIKGGHWPDKILKDYIYSMAQLFKKYLGDIKDYKDNQGKQNSKFYRFCKYFLEIVTDPENEENKYLYIDLPNVVETYIKELKS